MQSLVSVQYKFQVIVKFSVQFAGYSSMFIVQVMVECIASLQFKCL